MSDKKESVAYHSSLITHHSKETYTVKPSAKISFALFASLLFTLALSVSPTSAAGDTNWPQWRGPDGSGVSAEKGLPEEWGEAKNVRWKTPLPGRGHSSPVVWGKRVFGTTAAEGPGAPEKGLPEEWGEAKNVRWTTPLPGRGHSSPVVWGKRVFVTTAVEGPVE